MALVVQGLSGNARAQERERERAAGETAAEPEPTPQASPLKVQAKKGPLEVTVPGKRSGWPPVSTKDPMPASYVVPEERLRSPGATSADVFSGLPGVQIQRTGASSDYATVSIRGATSAQTPVYLAGVRINDDVTGTADLSAIPLWMLHRIEVFRGNAPEQADQLGIGGAIFFEPKLPKQNRIGVGLAGGSFGELGTWAAGTVAGRGASALIALRHDRADNDYRFVDDRGTRFDSTDDREVHRRNAAFTSYDAWSVGRYEIDRRARIVVLTNAFLRDQGVTGLSIIPAEAATARTQRLLGAASAKASCSRAPQGLDGGPCQIDVSSSASITRSSISDPLRELALQTTHLTTAGERLEQQARLVYRLDKPALRFGGSALQTFERLRVDQTGENVLFARRRATRATATLAWQPLAWLEIQGLGAVEWNATLRSATGSDTTENAVEPAGRASIRVRPLKHMELLVNAGRYVRAPTLGELYGTTPFLRGNPDLAGENGITADAGTRIATGGVGCASCRFYADGFVFARWAADLIAFKRSSFGVVRPFNVGSARVLGAELSAGADVLGRLLVEFNLTAMDPRDVSPERQVKNDILPFRSRLVAAPYLEVYAEDVLPQFGPSRAALGLRLLYRSSRFADPAGLLVIQDHVTVDLEASISLFDRMAALRFSVRNLFDAQQFDSIGLPLPGRSAHGAMEAWW